MKRPRRITLSRVLLLIFSAVVVTTFGTTPSCHASSSSSSSRWVSIAGFGRRNSRSQLSSSQSSCQQNSSSGSSPWFALPSSRRSLTVFTSKTTSPNTLSSWVRPAVAHAAAASSKATKGDFPREGDDEMATYAQLGPVGKVVAGTLEITVSTLLEFLSGFCGGYLLGTVTGLPAFVTKPVTPATSSFWQQFQRRAVRMHGKSARWGTSWGGISAAFGGFRVTTKVLRGGKEDEWSTILSSMAAGAFFARKGECCFCRRPCCCCCWARYGNGAVGRGRSNTHDSSYYCNSRSAPKEGPQAMLKGAFIYGGMMYLLSGKLMEKKGPFQYTEETIDL